MSTEDRVDAARERVVRFMAEEGKKNTRQRGVIVEGFLGAGGHLTLQELQALVREQEGAVGYATVYRTMKMLEEAGVAVERNFGTGQARYELAEFGTHHDHLICVGCNRHIEFEAQLIEERQDQIAERHGCLVQHHRHEIYGLCADCQ